MLYCPYTRYTFFIVFPLSYPLTERFDASDEIFEACIRVTPPPTTSSHWSVEGICSSFSESLISRDTDHRYSRSGLVVKFVLAMHEPRVRFTAATSCFDFLPGYFSPAIYVFCVR
jgi:hypothetical protein